MMFPQRMPSRKPEKKNDECQIDVKKTKNGIKTRFRGKCSREHLEYAKEEAKSLGVGEERRLDSFD